jgi:C4-dicarboxylate transporter
MLGRADKSNEMHIKARKVTVKVSVTMCVVIVASYSAWAVNGYFYYFNDGNYYNETLDNWSHQILPNVYLLIDCTLLLVALIWICRSLKHDKHMMGNEKYMGVHTILLLITFASQAYLLYCKRDKLVRENRYGISLKIWMVCNLITTAIIGFIMNQVNSP